MLLKMSAVSSLFALSDPEQQAKLSTMGLGMCFLVAGQLFCSLSTLRAYTAVTLVRVHQLALVEAVKIVRVIADNPEVPTRSFGHE